MRTLTLGLLLVLTACGTTDRTRATIARNPGGARLHIVTVSDPNIGPPGAVLGVYRAGKVVGIYRVDRREGHTLMGSLVAGTFEGEGRLELGTVTQAEVDRLQRTD